QQLKRAAAFIRTRLGPGAYLLLEVAGHDVGDRPGRGWRRSVWLLARHGRGPCSCLPPPWPRGWLLHEDDGTGCCPESYGRTRMIVFPLRRSVGLRAATASSRVATLPMFVRRRPSRTRWTISLSWARSASTTTSIARPSAGRASGGPT